MTLTTPIVGAKRPERHPAWEAKPRPRPLRPSFDAPRIGTYTFFVIANGGETR